MKIYVKDFDTYIKEKLSHQVYHYTNLTNATSIIKFNRFYLSSIFNSLKDNDSSHNYKYFLSVTRDKRTNTGYAKLINQRNNIYVRFEMDSDKISQRYKSVPFNYHNQTSTNRHQDFYEAEERILSNNRTINDAINYINKITILVKNERVRQYEFDDFIYFSKEYKNKIEFKLLSENKIYDFDSFFTKFPERKSKTINKKNINKKDFQYYSYLFLNILFAFKTDRVNEIDKYLESFNVKIPVSTKNEVTDLFKYHDEKSIKMFIVESGLLTTIGDKFYDSIINQIDKESFSMNQNMIEYILEALKNLCN